MYTEKNDIDQLFSKKFEKFEATASDGEWLALSSKLNRLNFVKFSFVTFNIYYLATLIALAGTATFTGISYHKEKQKVKQYEQIINSNPNIVAPIIREEVQTNESKVSNAPQVLKEDIKKKLEPVIKPTEKASPKEKLDQVSVESTKTEPLAADTMQKKAAEAVLEETKPITKITKIKKTLVVKPKPIIVKDSVIINKR